MTLVALQARLRSVELDGKDQREALEKVEALQASLAAVVDRLTKRVDDLGSAGGDEAKTRLEAMEARVAEITRLQLELASHDDRLEALEEGEAGGRDAPTDELLSLDARVGALESGLSEGASPTELARRLEAAEVGLADAQRALADAHSELERRDAEMVEVLRRLQALEAAARTPGESLAQSRGAAEDAGGRSGSGPVSAAESELAARSSDSAPAPDAAREPVPLTDVKGIGPKLSKKLIAAGLTDARVLAAMDAAALDSLAEASGVKRGRLDRLCAAAADL